MCSLARWLAAPYRALEGVHRDVEMGVGMPEDPQRFFADLDLDTQFLAELAPQTGAGRLALPAFPAGEFPQSAQQAAFRSAADQDATHAAG